MRLFLVTILLALLPTPAFAEWHEVQSTHFVIYADDSERDLRHYAERLEKYHIALEIVTGRELPPPSPSNRVTVYIVGNAHDVSRLFGEGGRNVGGFYVPFAGATAAFIPNLPQPGRSNDWPLTVLLHEYAHHFLISSSAYPPPRWVGEGSAEFFASTRFNEDGSVSIGVPAAHRYYELAEDNVEVEELLDPEALALRNLQRFNSFYGKSWALYHFLSLEPARRGQLGAYLLALRSGTPARQAAEATFGDLAVLEREVHSYVRRPRLTSLRFSAGQLEPGPVAIRRLTEGEVAAVQVRMRSRRGVDAETAAAILADARPLAARYPADATIFSALAEAEFDAGNPQEAIAAADRALALDPGQVNAYVQKGYALFQLAGEMEAGPQQIAGYGAAVAPFLALNRIENDHPLPLFFYHRSFAQTGEVPDVAKQGLRRALELAPFDISLRMAHVQQLLRDGELPEAANRLRPIAFSPHGGWLSEKAIEVIARIDAGATAEMGDELVAMLIAPPPEAPAGEEGTEP